MHVDILLNPCHFTLCTTFTVLAVGPSGAEASCDMTGKTQTVVAKSLGPSGALLGLLLYAGTVSICCPIGQLMQGEYFHSLLNERSAANVLLQNS